MEKLTNLLNISPEYSQAFFWMCCCIGLVVVYRFRKLVIIISLGAISIYNFIKNSFGVE